MSPRLRCSAERRPDFIRGSSTPRYESPIAFDGEVAMGKLKKSVVRVRCPHCQAVVVLGPSVVRLGGRVALVCPECHEVTVA